MRPNLIAYVAAPGVTHEFSGTFGDGLYAQNLLGVGVDDDLDRAAGVAVDERAWDLVESHNPATAVVTGDEGFGLGHPDGGQLRGCEGHGRKTDVIYAPVGASDGVVGNEGALSGSDVDELGSAGHVTGGPDAGIGCPLGGIDDHEAAVVEIHAGVVEAQVAGARSATGSDQDGVADASRAIIARDGHTRCCSRNGLGPGVVDVDSVIGEDPAHPLGEFGFGAWGDMSDKMNLATEAGEELGLFHPDETASDNHEPAGQVRQVHSRCRGEVARVGQAW